MQSHFCRRLGLEVPIVQAPMNWATDAKLAAAVSEAGGLGTLGPNAGLRAPLTRPDDVKRHMADQVEQIRRLTNRPFALNVPIAKGTSEIFTDVMAQVAIDERVPVAIVVSGSPEILTERLKAAGVFVIHAVSSVAHALKARSAGVDAVVVESFEGGGHSGQAEMTLAVLVPQVVDAVDIPVIAAGGIVDGRGLLMGFAAGAQAVYMGTRFLACFESPVHASVKAAIVRAKDTATISWGRRTGVARTLNNSFSQRIRALEEQGVPPDVIHAVLADYGKAVNRRVGGLLEGDLEEGEIYLGAGVGMIKSVATAADIIAMTMHQARNIARELASSMGSAA